MASTTDFGWRALGLRLQALLPALLLGLLALLTYWLVQNSPIINDSEAPAPKSSKPDAFFYRFNLIGFDERGDWRIQISGDRAWHRPDLESYEIDRPNIVKRDDKTRALTVVRANKARSDEDGTVVQLFGQAEVKRGAYTDAQGKSQDPMDVRSDYLQIDDRSQTVETHMPVTIVRGGDQLSAGRLQAQQLDGTLKLEGRVHGTLVPRRAQGAQTTQ
jgi:lipopolysaccharide export system protein LptC